MHCQAREMGATCCATWGPSQNRIKAHQLDRHSGQEVLHMRLLQAIKARSSYSHALSSRTPPSTGLALRTGGLQVLPIDLEMRYIEALVCFGLPAVVREDRTNELAALLLLTLHAQCSIDVACIHDLFLGQEVMRGQVLLNDLCHVHVLHIGHARLHLHNELRHGSCLGILSRLKSHTFG